MNYYKRHIGDYMKDASHLSLLEHGVYMRLLDVYYTKESAIPVDQAARFIGARSKEEKQALADISNEFFKVIDGFLTHKRCEEEIATMLQKAETNRLVGKLGGRPKKETIKVSENNPEITQMVSENNPSHKPITNNHKPIDLTNAVENLTSSNPKAAGSVCASLKKLNITGINPSNPMLIALINSGASLDEFVNAASNSQVKKFNYVLAVVKGQREEAMNLKVHQGDLPKSKKEMQKAAAVASIFGNQSQPRIEKDISNEVTVTA